MLLVRCGELKRRPPGPGASLRAVVRALLAAAMSGAACVHAPAPVTAPVLDVETVEQLMPAKVRDKDGWARDLLAAFEDNGLRAELNPVCAVLAVVEQESGFQANPVVPNLPQVARKALEEKARALGPLGGPVLKQ